MVSNPGHTFDTNTAKIIWRTRSKYKSQLVEAACINRFPSCNISKGEIRVTPAMSAFTTYIAGLHRQSGHNTIPDGCGSITSTPQPSTSTHILPSHAPSPFTSRPLSSGNTASLPTSNIGTPPLDVGNSSRQHISIPTISPTTVSHMSHTTSSNSTSISVTSGHSTSSQVLTSSYHRSLRRIISQDQEISTSPRSLRNRNSQTTSQM